jgi:hypothetical protein
MSIPFHSLFQHPAKGKRWIHQLNYLTTGVVATIRTCAR